MSKILVIHPGNPQYVEIQTKVKLCEYQWKHSPPPDEQLLPTFVAFREAIRSLPGVERVNIGKHDITIERFEIFEWDEILTPILKLLADYTEPHDEIEYRDRRFSEDVNHDPD